MVQKTAFTLLIKTSDLSLFDNCLEEDARGSTVCVPLFLHNKLAKFKKLSQHDIVNAIVVQKHALNKLENNISHKIKP